MQGVLIEILAWDRAQQQRVTVRMGAALNSATLGCDGVQWEPVVNRAPRLSLQLVDDDYAGDLTLASSEFSFNAGRLRTVQRPLELEWTGSRVRIWRGDGRALTALKLAFQGIVRSGTPDADTGVVEIRAEVDSQLLDVPLLTAAYGGNGGVDGDAEIRGTLKPACFGSPFNVRPILIDQTNDVYQIDAFGNLQGISGVYEDAASMGQSFGNYATYAALVAATIPDGRWATCTSAGMFRLGAPAVGVITCDPIAGSGLPGSFIQRLIAAHTTFPIARVALDDLSALTAAVQTTANETPAIAFWTSEAENVLDLVKRMCGSCNAMPIIGFDGVLRVSRLTGGAVALTIDRQGGDLPVTAWQSSDGPVPWWRMSMEAARTFYVHSAAEIDYEDDLVERGFYDAAETYRQGNIVTLPDQSRWLYINATPASGVYPAENAYWTVLTSAPKPVPDFYTVGARGNAAQVPGRYLHGLRRQSGEVINSAYARSYTVSWMNATTGVWSTRSFDVYANGQTDYGFGTGGGGNNATTGSDAGAMARYLAALPNGSPVVVYTSDEPRINRLNGGLPEQMYRCGASPAIFGGDGTVFPNRAAYILVGTVGVGAGGAAIELVREHGVDDSANSWLLTSFSIVNGVVAIGGRDGTDGQDGTDGTDGLPGAPGANGQTSYVHYAYANAPDGSLDFTTGAPGDRAYEGSYTDFVQSDSTSPAAYVWRPYKGPPFGLASRGAAIIAGNQIAKYPQANSDWDSDAYSTVGFRGSARASFRFPLSIHAMAGLNTDPTTNASFTSLDFAWYCEGNNMRIYENGNPVGAGIYASRDPNAVYSISYDGPTVTYEIDGVPQRQVATAPGQILYFDSSLNTPGGRIADVQFNAGAQRPAGLTLIPYTERTITSATGVRIFGNRGGWGAGKATSRERYAGGAVAEWTFGAPANANMMAGLAQNQAGGNSYDSITFAVHVNDSGATGAYINGASYAAGPTVSLSQPVRCKVAYDGRQDVVFSINGTPFATYSWGEQSDALCFAAALASSDPILTEISFSQAGKLGAKGLDGSNGAPGAPGANGQTSYFHTAFANSPNGTVDFTTGAPGGRAYIGTYTDTTLADSVNPASYEWTAYKGPPLFGLQGRGNVVIAGNMAIKSGGSEAWDSDAFSTEGYRGGASVTFQPASSSEYFMAGLNSDPTTNASFNSLDYAWYLIPEGPVQIYESGNGILQPFTGYSSTDVFQVVYDGKRVRYLRNGIVYRDVATTGDRLFYFDSSIARPNSRITNISFSDAGTSGDNGVDGTPGAPGSPGAPGAAGTDGFVLDTETTNFVQPVYSGGASKPSWTGGSGTIRLIKGGQRITSGVTYSVLNNSGVATLALSGDTFTFAGATGDIGAFTIRATFNGVNYDKVVSVKKVYDGEAAFKGTSQTPPTQISSQELSTTGSTPVPAGRSCNISASANYNMVSQGNFDYLPTISIYWRNVTDNGPWNLLQQAQGSNASVRNTGTAQEPNYVYTPGTASVAADFIAPSADKQIGFEARMIRNTGGGTVQAILGVKLEVRS